MFSGWVRLFCPPVLALPVRRLALGGLVRRATRKSLVNLEADPSARDAAWIQPLLAEWCGPPSVKTSRTPVCARDALR
jgi:hypothetical protein